MSNRVFYFVLAHPHLFFFLRDSPLRDALEARQRFKVFLGATLVFYIQSI